MGLFAEPNLLDIIVSLLIGLIAGGLITSLIFILIIKKRWEMKWEYLNKIKSISRIQLPQMEFNDSSLSKGTLQRTVIGNSSISDKRFVERVWTEDTEQIPSSNESLFLTPSDYDRMQHSQTSSHPEPENIPNDSQRSGKKKAQDNITQMQANQSISFSSNLSGSTLGKPSNEPDQILIDDDDDLPLAIRLNSFKKLNH